MTSATSIFAVGFGLYFAVVFGLRTIQHLRTTGSSGFHGISGKPGSLEWLGGVLFVASIALGALAPVLVAMGVENAAPKPAFTAVGSALYAAGFAAVWWSQAAMGKSWRVGVDRSEVLSLVVDGPFAFVRNPIFSSMVVTAVGLALVLPTLTAWLGVVALVAAIELQVRVVEEPCLARIGGTAYAAYAARTGRFVPGLGRLARRGDA